MCRCLDNVQTLWESVQNIWRMPVTLRSSQHHMIILSSWKMIQQVMLSLQITQDPGHHIVITYLFTTTFVALCRESQMLFHGCHHTSASALYRICHSSNVSHQQRSHPITSAFIDEDIYVSQFQIILCCIFLRISNNCTCLLAEYCLLNTLCVSQLWSSVCGEQHFDNWQEQMSWWKRCCKYGSDVSECPLAAHHAQHIHAGSPHGSWT